MNDYLQFGIFKETCPHLADKLPSIKSMVRESRHPDVKVVCDYLRRGDLNGLLAGKNVVDTLDQNMPVITRSIKLLSDGEWVWPEPIIYFLEKYSLDISPEFVSHVRTRRQIMHRETISPDSSCCGTSQDRVAETKEMRTAFCAEIAAAEQLFPHCMTMEDVRMSLEEHSVALKKCLDLDALDESQRNEISAVLSTHFWPPKFDSYGVNLTGDELKESRGFALSQLLANGNRIAMSWSDVDVV